MFTTAAMTGGSLPLASISMLWTLVFALIVLAAWLAIGSLIPKREK